MQNHESRLMIFDIRITKPSFANATCTCPIARVRLSKYADFRLGQRYAFLLIGDSRNLRQYADQRGRFIIRRKY